MTEPIILENHELTIEIEMAAKGEKRPRIKISPLSRDTDTVESILKRADELALGGIKILKDRFDAEFR